jgi:hypothetical protein
MTGARILCLAVALVGLAVVERSARAGACTNETCKCDDDCSGLVCGPTGHCCGAPITGTPCAKDGGASGAGGGSAGAGAGGTTGGAGATGSAGSSSSGGGCRVAGDATLSHAGLVACALLLCARRARRRFVGRA